MAYYTTLTLRGAPLRSKVITLDALRAVLALSIGGGGFRSNTLGFQSHKRQESYKGFEIPHYVKFYQIDRQGDTRHDFFACLIGDDIELLRSQPSVTWPSWGGDTAPTQADWDAVFAPVQDVALQAKAEEIFAAILSETSGHRSVDVSDAEKLAAVPSHPVRFEALGRLAQLIALEKAEFDPVVDDIVHSAYNPVGFLQSTGRVSNMTLDGCRHFSWYKVLMQGDLRKANRIAVIDWKFGVEDVVWNVSTVLGEAFTLKSQLPADAMGHDVLKVAQAQLWRPGFLKAKHALIMLGSEGDSIAFTIVPKAHEAETMRLAAELGLKPEGPR